MGDDLLRSLVVGLSHAPAGGRAGVAVGLELGVVVADGLPVAWRFAEVRDECEHDYSDQQTDAEAGQHVAPVVFVVRYSCHDGVPC